MRKRLIAFAKWWMLTQVIGGAVVGTVSGVYLAVYFTPEEVERIISCVAH